MSDSAWGGYEGVMAVFGGIMAVTLVASMGVSVRKDGVEEGQEQEARYVEKIGSCTSQEISYLHMASGSGSVFVFAGGFNVGKSVFCF